MDYSSLPGAYPELILGAVRHDLAERDRRAAARARRSRRVRSWLGGSPGRYARREEA
jgi:hypothetical protein